MIVKMFKIFLLYKHVKTKPLMTKTEIHTGMKGFIVQNLLFLKFFFWFPKDKMRAYMTKKK